MNTLDFLRANEHKDERVFITQTQYLKSNWSWLKYSYAIAIKIRRRMKESGITQRQLAQQLGCSQQHISVLLGGKSNMTLETISKLEHALSMDLIGDSLKGFGYAIQDKGDVGYLNDSAADKPSPSGMSTSEIVEGYTPRKKKGPKPNRQPR